jgi:hypothetical protein
MQKKDKKKRKDEIGFSHYQVFCCKFRDEINYSLKMMAVP